MTAAEHLDTHHKSAMAELLQAYSGMPVVEIIDRARVEADRVYVIPPNATLGIEQGTLRIVTPRSRPDEELPKLGIDVLLATVHQKLDILDHFQHGAILVERLGPYPWAITIVDAVVSSLENCPESVFQPIASFVSRLVLVRVGQRRVVHPRDTDEPDL